MTHPPQPYGQQPQQGPYQQPMPHNGQYPPQYQGQPGYPQQAPAPYGQPHPQQYATGGHPVQQPPQVHVNVQQTVQQNVHFGGRGRVRWTFGEATLVLFTCGLAWPYVWMRHQRLRKAYYR